jgi:hypothetical protein
MKKLVYLAAMAILGLGLTMAQNASTPSDPSNSSKSAQTGTPAVNATPNSGAPDQTAPAKNGHRQQGNVPDTTVRDQQGSTTSTTGASGQSDSRPSNSTMGTTGSTPGTENSTPPDNGSSDPQTGTTTDQQPNSSSSPTTPTPHLVMNQTPAARAVATHTPDPGTCMNPAAVQTGQYPTPPPRNCD